MIETHGKTFLELCACVSDFSGSTRCWRGSGLQLSWQQTVMCLSLWWWCCQPGELYLISPNILYTHTHTHTPQGLFLFFLQQLVCSAGSNLWDVQHGRTLEVARHLHLREQQVWHGHVSGASSSQHGLLQERRLHPWSKGIQLLYISIHCIHANGQQTLLDIFTALVKGVRHCSILLPFWVRINNYRHLTSYFLFSQQAIVWY